AVGRRLGGSGGALRRAGSDQARAGGKRDVRVSLRSGEVTYAAHRSGVAAPAVGGRPRAIARGAERREPAADRLVLLPREMGIPGRVSVAVRAQSSAGAARG